MKALKIHAVHNGIELLPSAGGMSLVDLPDDIDELVDNLFPDSLPAHVWFAQPGTLSLYEWRKDQFGIHKYVVMLVDDNFLIRGLDHNPAASALSGRIILGDAYLVLEHRDMMEGDTWSDIMPPYDEPEFWESVLADG